MTHQQIFQVGTYELDGARFYEAETHLWAARRSETAVRCGFDPLGAETCGDIVAVSFEPIGTRVERGEPFGWVEAAKFVGPLLAPVSGSVSAHNSESIADPSRLNADPMGAWLAELESASLDLELAALLTGRQVVETWFTAELERFERQGMIAE